MPFIFKANILLILSHVSSTLVSTCNALSHSISKQSYELDTTILSCRGDNGDL